MATKAELDSLTTHPYGEEYGNRNVKTAQPHTRTYGIGDKPAKWYTKITADGGDEREGRPTLREANYPGVMGFPYGDDDDKVLIDVHSGNEVEGQIWRIDMSHLAPTEISELPITRLQEFIPIAFAVSTVFDPLGNFATYWFLDPEMRSGVVMRQNGVSVSLYTFETIIAEQEETEVD